jgi:aminoglycoside/choline kinase family phosphotransferase
MFLGPSAYDVASLCQDARITIPADVEWALRDRYVALRRAGDPGFDADSFMTAYAIAAAVRAVKNLGVFAGLAGAGKPHYLNHLPRMSDYLARAFAHPVLSPLAVWYEKRLNP